MTLINKLCTARKPSNTKIQEDGPLQIYPHTLHLHVTYGRSTAIKTALTVEKVYMSHTHEAAMHFVFLKMNESRGHAYFLYANCTEQRLKDDRRNIAHLQTSAVCRTSAESLKTMTQLLQSIHNDVIARHCGGCAITKLLRI